MTSGDEASHCPYCKRELVPPPKGTRRCPFCGEEMHLVRVCGRDHRRLMTDAEADQNRKHWQEYGLAKGWPTVPHSETAADEYRERDLAEGRWLEESGLKVEKNWLTARDEHVCAICRANERQGWIPLAENFQSGHSYPMAHEGCRCCGQIQRAGATKVKSAGFWRRLFGS